MPITSTETEDFTAALEQAVAERGASYVYPEDKKATFGSYNDLMCQYFDREDPTKPLCFIGVALSKLGVTNEDIYAIKPAIDYGQGGLTASALRIMENLGFGPYVSAAAREAQRVQDQGGTWGEALKTYYRCMGL